jgi:hypothetical protein
MPVHRTHLQARQREGEDRVMSSLAKLLRRTSTIMTVTDPGWIEHVTGGPRGYADVFGRDYSGYWMRGMAHTAHRGWIAFEHGDDDACTEEAARAAIRLWRNDEPLPPLWHRLDLDLANRAWCEGVKRYGENWYADGDGPRYDWALQTALFGEAKYG